MSDTDNNWQQQYQAQYTANTASYTELSPNLNPQTVVTPPVPVEETIDEKIAFDQVDRDPENFVEIVPNPHWGDRARHLDNRDCAMGDIVEFKGVLGRIITYGCQTINVVWENNSILVNGNYHPEDGFKLYWPKKNRKRR